MNFKRFYREFKGKLKRQIIEICSSSNRLSNIYYFFFSSAFDREHHSVLVGKAKYLNDIESGNSSQYQLVRNIHRIEKGLLMRPRRNVFALGYLEETIDCFEKLLSIENRDNGQLKWAHDVLKMYFEVTTGNDNSFIEIQNERFNLIVSDTSFSNASELTPYHNKTISNINFEEYYKLAIQRRSTRWFKKTKVPRELIDKAISAAIQSPSACNRQPFEYRVIDEEWLLNEIIHLPMGTKGYAHNIPAMIVAVGNLDAYFSERDRHLIYIDASLANMSLMFAFETLGLSSCPINWPDIEKLERKMQQLFQLGKYQRPIMCMAIGYSDPKGKVASSKKKDINKIRQYN